MTKEEVDKRTLEMKIEYPDYLSEPAVDLLKQLLDRDPEKRLGGRGRGAVEVRSHLWFEDIDWQALVDHQITPEIKPEQGQVNAKDVYDIDKFDHHDVRKIVITPEDNAKYYKHFDHIMSHQWQEEVLVMYDIVTATCDKEAAKRASKIKSGAEFGEVDDPPGCTHQGYLNKLSSGMFKSFKRRYAHLYPDRLELRVEQLKHAKTSIMLADVTSITEDQMKDSAVINIEVAGKPFVFRCDHQSDHSVWLEVLLAAWEDAKAPSKVDSIRKVTKSGVSKASLLEDEGPSTPTPETAESVPEIPEAEEEAASS